ncbi:MAG TPA: hypothetical protein PKD45_13550 [Flavobacteriales bacterium]|nr:hypothetical protein [Flavobacteriales bacterium]
MPIVKTFLLGSAVFLSAVACAQEPVSKTGPANGDIVAAQDNGKLLAPTTEMNGTVFGSYVDASLFLKGLIDADADAYGNLILFRNGTGGQRNAFRLSDVILTAKEFITPMEYKGGEIGPRVEITIKCKLGPCVADPALPRLTMDESSFFVTDNVKGRKVYSTLLIMQGFLKK